jgi:hypothetical protein
MGAKRWTIDNERVVSEVLDGEAVIVDLAAGHYHAATGVAATVWQAIGAALDVEAIVDLAGRSHRDVPATATDEITRFIDQLLHAGLITPAPDGTVPSDVQPPAEPTPWVPPRLESHDDLEDLLVLDPVHDVTAEGWPNAAAAPAE